MMRPGKVKYDIAQIVKQFRIDGDFLSAEPYGTGHIHDTFRIACGHGGHIKRYIVQRINHSVFRNPPNIMKNIVRVTGHIRNKLQNEGLADAARHVTEIIPAHNGDGYCRDPEGHYWRVYTFIEGTRTYDVPDTPARAYQAARAFGRFGRYLADLPEPPLIETIPDFHHTPKRFKAFIEVLNCDSHNRACRAKEEIQFVLKHAGMCDVLLSLYEKGHIPRRVTHNDTKINNVLFDEKTDEGICVIDLDTVMPGLSLYDFGDMVRTATCKAAEDERDLSKIEMDITFFEQIAKGFCLETAGLMTEAEKRHLVFAGKLIPFEQMIRFLTDYLNGDTYYKIHRPGQNLDRTRTQMKLVQSIQTQEEQMMQMVGRSG